ncbi:MAG: hypothetical protein JO199_10845 [Candidatus Eremiobacteraeota bacterium]|nr:hypothetical protein [Candidatus Eremiobacteraeota bacterium]
MKSRIGLSAALLAAFVLGVVSVHPVAKAMEMFGITKCATTTPCDGGANTTGAGVQGTSTGNHGVIGKTSYASTSGTRYRAGLFGQDVSTTGTYDAGVAGVSTRGTGVLGTSSSLFGVEGLSSSNVGVWGQDGGSKGQPTGVVGYDQSTTINGAGVAGQTKVGSGIVGSTTGTSPTTTQAILGLAPNGGLIFVGAGVRNGIVATLDGSGNLTINGQIYTAGSCASGCARRYEASYGDRVASPTIEDSGEAQLSMGVAYIRLDPSFANAIDQHKGYYVLLTPETDTRGLYVAQRTPSGFAVRESAGGRSSGQFAYRIVAHPYGVTAPKLPFVDRQPIAAQLRSAQ